MMNSISQFATINALMAGLYDGVFSVKEILNNGDFGLGCSHALGGEVIILDGKIIEARGDGVIRTMTEEEKLPFAQVTKFKAEQNINLDNISKDALHDFLSSRVKFDNIFLAIRYDGSLKKIKIRRPIALNKPYKSILEVTDEQVVDDLENITGTLIGFFSPNFFSTISVPQFHLHFLSKDEKICGHVMDFYLEKGIIQFERKLTLDIKLPEDQDFLNKDLNIDGMAELIHHVEN